MEALCYARGASADLGKLSGGFMNYWRLAREIEREVLWIDHNFPGQNIDLLGRAVLGCGLYTQELQEFLCTFLMITPVQLYDLGIATNSMKSTVPGQQDVIVEYDVGIPETAHLPPPPTCTEVYTGSGPSTYGIAGARFEADNYPGQLPEDDE